MAGSVGDAGRLISATLKFLPHSLQFLRAKHLAINTCTAWTMHKPSHSPDHIQSLTVLLPALKGALQVLNLHQHQGCTKYVELA